MQNPEKLNVHVKEGKRTGLLPLPTQNLILRHLSPLDRYRYSLANKEAYFAVSSFNRQAFRIEHILLRYFNQEDIDKFRLIQLKTDTLISGSAALQFFDLSVFEDSDLDLYILREWDRVMLLSGFLVSISYDFVPRQGQPQSFQQAFEEGTPDEAEDLDPDYSSRNIWDVYSFVRASDGKKIQIITCRKNTVQVIQGFHSTCVMNAISYTHAYSLYPHATFVERRSIIIRGPGDSGFTKASTLRALLKYADRGWGTDLHPSKTNVLRSRSEFRETARSVGDSACWTIALTPVQHALSMVDYDAVPPSLDHVRANSWYTILTETGTTQIGSQVRQHSSTSQVYSYTVPAVPQKLWKSHAVSHLEDPDNLQLFPRPSSIEDLAERTHEMFDAEPDVINETARNVVSQAYAAMPLYLNMEGQPLAPSTYSLALLVRQLEILFNLFREDPSCSITFRIDHTGKLWTYAVITLPPNHPRRLILTLKNAMDDHSLGHLLQHRISITFQDGSQALDLGYSRIRRW